MEETLQAAPEPSERELAEGELEELRPSFAARAQKLSLGGEEQEYVQKPLSFFGKVQLFGVLGEAIDRAMSGPDGLSLDDVLGMDQRALAKGAVGLDGFAKAIARLSSYAPDLVLEVYCIALSVPVGERNWAKLAMQQTEEEGGLSDDDGISILETFIDQNEAALKDFFAQRLKPMFERVRKSMSPGSGDGPRSSKRSKNTQATTRRRSKS